MIFLGIDPGTAITGYGFIRENKDGNLEVVDYGVITTGSKLPLEERLLKIYKELEELILLHNPSTGAVEKVFFSTNAKTAMSVGHARGVILLVLAKNGVPLADYSPMDVKQAVVGYGIADKNQVQQMVKAILNLDDIPRPDDAADALAVAICHYHSYRYNNLSG